MERRLAAIVAADVVGYSRLMGMDEMGTLSALNAHRRELIEPKTRQYRGRIVKLMGDGSLLEFASAVDAVSFAVEVQWAMRGRNDGIPENRRIIYRVGINIGDIILEDGDIFGDGVNIAARLEGLAEPGGICIARNVYGQVKGKLDLSYELIGRRKVKNIAEPVQVYRIAINEKAERLTVESGDVSMAVSWRIPAAGTAAVLLFAGGAWLAWPVQTSLPQRLPPPATSTLLAAKPSIAVLPFANMSGSPDQAYFSDGLAQDLITDLSRISGLTVIARNSSFSYKGQAADIRQISRELGARYLVEGSVRRSGDQIRITAQLVEASTGHQLWAERYDRELKDIFALQDDVREKIVAALQVKLSPSQKTQLSHTRRIGVEAYDLFLRAIEQEGYFTKESNLASRSLYRKVVEREPGFAEAHARLANSYDVAAIMGWSEDRDTDLGRALAEAEKAVALDPALPYAHWTLGRVLTHFDRNEEAIRSIQRAIDLSPNYADAHAYLSLVGSYVGNASQGLKAIDRAITLNPKPPFWYYYARGLALYLLERHEEAITDLLRSIEGNPNVTWSRHYLIAAYGHLGNTAEADWQIGELSIQGYDVTLEALRRLTSIRDTTYLSRYLADLRKAGVPE